MPLLTSVGGGTGKYNPKGQSEAAIIQQIIKALTNAFVGSYIRKFHGGLFQRAGLPDIYFLYQGKSFWFEVKKPGGDTTALQKANLEQLNAAGAYVGVVSSAKEVVEKVRETIKAG